MIGDRQAWGKGLGTLLAQFALDYAFDWLNLNRVHVTMLATNTRSIAMCERVGFQQEGLMRQAQFKGGEYIDVVVMSKLRDD